MRVLVLGGYGLIGSAISRALIGENYSIIGLARSAAKGEAMIPAAQWIGADISKLTQPEQWHAYLEEIDVVVNASGALQNGLSDNLKALQQDAIIALIKACEQKGTARFIQISAPDAEHSSETEFYRTKAAADAALKQSELSWTIFRPALVISPQAYGGTSLVRILAAFPCVQPIMLGQAPIQTVFIDDVAGAVALAIKQDISGVDVDLTEQGSQSLQELTLKLRQWLGFVPPRMVWNFPIWAGRMTAFFADMAGWLGWRPALRTTALKVLADGVTGDAKPWLAFSETPNRDFAQSLEAMPSTVQERIYARAMLVFPLLLLTLAGFWMGSGLIGLMQHGAAISKLDGALSPRLASLFVVSGSIADIVIGGALLFRRFARLACFASIGLAGLYLGASAWLTPHLWLDPLGPMVKVFPAIALALIVAALMERR